MVYATGGRELLMLEVVVDMASRVVMVSATRAGADLWSNQKDIQDTQTKGEGENTINTVHLN